METGRRGRGATAFAIVAALCAAVVVLLPGRAEAMVPLYPADSCYDAYVDCGTSEGDSSVLTESVSAYAYAPGSCRTRWARATRRNLAHLVVYRYNEQVRWCWSAGLITYFWRDRWASDTAFGWIFDRQLGSNCALEHCNGRGVGTYSTDAWTQGEFHACVIWYCPHRYPLVDIWVHGDGGSGASWSGA
jgi:hypothetical protein